MKSNTGKVFLFWPFLAFVFSLTKFKNKTNRITIIFFLTLLGLCLVFNRETMDGYQHTQRFNELKGINLNNFIDEVADIILFKSLSNVDLYAYASNFLISRLTDDARFLFVFHSLIFSLLFIGFLGKVYDDVGGLHVSASILVFILLIFINPITNVHFVRFPLASWIFVTSVYGYLKLKKLKYLGFALFSVLVHFAMAYGVIVFLLYCLIGNRPWLYVIVLVVSFILPNLFYDNLSFLDQRVDENGLDKKIGAYSNAEYIELRREGLASSAWYRAYRIQIIQYSIYFVMMFVILNSYLKKRADAFQQNILSFLILLLAFVNFGFSFDSLGRRFFLVWLVLACVFLIRHFNFFSSIKEIKLLSWILLLPVVFYSVMQLRIGLEIISASWFLGNIILMIFGGIDKSLLDFLG